MFYKDVWHVASIFDAEGNVVQFNTLVAEETGYEMEPINQEHTAGEMQCGERNLLRLCSSEFDGEAQLSSWKADRTPLAAVALSRSTHGRNYRWTEYRKLMESVPFPKPAASEGESYLKATWQDYNVEPVRVRNLITGSAGAEIILPIAGETLTLAATKGSAFDLELTAFDFDDTELDTVTASFDDERGSVALVLPADTWKVTWDLDGATDGSLRADGKTEYVAT